MAQEAWGVVNHHPRYWLIVRLLPLLNSLGLGIAAIGSFLMSSSEIDLLIVLPFIALLFLIPIATAAIWQHRQFREALRQKLLDASIRPRICFECGYDLEGYEGTECPACDAPLLRQPTSPRSMS